MSTNLDNYGAPNEIGSPTDIDDILQALHTVDDEIEHLKQLKKHRTAKIQDEITKLEEIQSDYRDSIRQHMSESGEKRLNYPGVGKVSRRAGTRKWEVKDNESLLDFLSTHLPEKQLEDMGVIKKEVTFVKKELNKLLDKLKDNGNIPEEIVEEIVSQESISITFDKDMLPSGVDVDDLLQAKSTKGSTEIQEPLKIETKSDPETDDQEETFDALFE
jgi:phage host-nuclease inhibitor protein Gam